MSCVIKDFISEPILDFQNECDDGAGGAGAMYIHNGKLGSNNACYQIGIFSYYITYLLLLCMCDYVLCTVGMYIRPLRALSGLKISD